MTSDPLPGRPLGGDAAWNYAAFAVTAVVGAGVMLLLAGVDGAAAVGVLAQLYAVHVIGAQVAVFGVHDSAQKHIAENAGTGTGDAVIVRTGLGLVLLVSTTLAAVLVACAGPIGRFTSSDEVALGLYLTAPGIVCFALNKVLFGAINGRGALRTYARMQLLRAAFVLISAMAIVLSDLPVYAVGAIFASAELALLPFLLVVVGNGRRAPDGGSAGEWWRRHAAFGGLGLVNSVLLETHLRVDVLTLSYFASDQAIGVYAFAVLFAEGIYQVPVVLRTVAYPTIVRLAARGQRAEVTKMARRLSLASGAIAGLAALAVATLFPMIAALVDAEFLPMGTPVLRVILVGITIYAFVVPVDQLLLQSGFPGRQSAVMAAYVAVNLALNLILIPRYGLMGAAAATSVALAAGAGLLLLATWRWLGYRHGVLFHRVVAS